MKLNFHPFQTVQEFILYTFLVLVLILQVVTNFQVKQLLNNHTQTIQLQEKQTKQVELNQHTNSRALEAFIRDGLVCIFTTAPDPAASRTQITNEVDNCFQNTPEVK
jgi:competence protein ComGC